MKRRVSIGGGALLCLVAACDYAADIGSVSPQVEDVASDGGVCAEGDRCDNTRWGASADAPGDAGADTDGAAGASATPPIRDSGIRYEPQDEPDPTAEPWADLLADRPEWDWDSATSATSSTGKVSLLCEDGTNESHRVAVVCDDGLAECHEFRAPCGAYRCDAPGLQCLISCETRTQCASGAICQLKGCTFTGPNPAKPEANKPREQASVRLARSS